MKKGIAIVLIVLSCFLFVLGGCSSLSKRNAQREIDETTHEQVAVIDRDSVPIITTDEDGEGVAVLDAQNTANLMYTMHKDDDSEDEMYTQALLIMNEQDNEVIVKNVRNMTWAPASIVISIAVIVIAIVVLFWLATRKEKGGQG